MSPETGAQREYCTTAARKWVSSSAQAWHLRPLLRGRVRAVLPLHAQLVCVILEGAHALGDVLTAARGHAQAAVLLVLDVLRARIVQPDCVCVQEGRSMARDTCQSAVASASAMRGSALSTTAQGMRQSQQ